MKNIILQHYTGALGQLEEYSIENISNYAKVVGADYKFLEGQVFRPHLTTHCQKLFMLDESFDEYDNVMMLDIDMFITSYETQNVFDVPGIGLYEDTQRRLHLNMQSGFPGVSTAVNPYWGGAIYKMNRSTRTTLRSAIPELSGLSGGGRDNPYMHYDEGIMHMLACKTNFNAPTNYLPRKWCYCSFLPGVAADAGFIHIRTKIRPEGPKRTKMENLRELVSKGIINI